MKAFISYSHQDTHILDVLHKHLVQLKRDGIIETWTDQEILAGGNLDLKINLALDESGLFIALISPDYIASNYCYEKEFQYALTKQITGDIIIVPIIVDSCDWHSTPFSKFKALPKDGKAISSWENKNTAFLDVVQNLRKLLIADGVNAEKSAIPFASTQLSRNYKIQKDFDSIEKLEFLEKTFGEVREYLKRYIEEIVQLDNIKIRMLNDSHDNFECLLVNRNKIATESQLKFTSQASNSPFSGLNSNDKQINYTISKNSNPVNSQFILSYDDFHLFWLQNDFFSRSNDKKVYNSKDIAEQIWSEWLISVGIL